MGRHERDSMKDFILTDRDLKRIEAEGLTREKVLAQMELFRNGSFPVMLNRPCTIDDGIVALTAEDEKECIRIYEGAAQKGRVMKFVPASGAASRMFQDWIRFRQEERFPSDEEELRFYEDIKKYAFYVDLREVLLRDGLDIDALIAGKRCDEIFDYILTLRGLQYAFLPKALLKFHVYAEQNRTSLEEHLVEAALYTRDKSGTCRIHFTVSEEHEQLVREYLLGIQGHYENRHSVTFHVEISTQRSSTHTVAVDSENRIIRDSSGTLVFRPGGHGALLENLNDLNGDIVMVKNIDNVVPDRLKSQTVFYKKVLGGYLLKLQRESFGYLEELSAGVRGPDLLSRAGSFCREKLCVSFPKHYDGMSNEKKRKFVFEKLNRPIRVCGMVRNEGEPGGGPFWVEGNEMQTLQIIEAAQIDWASEDQRKTWVASTHFNPVDIACGIRDFQSQKFELQTFVDEKTYIISNKFQDGLEIRTLELPGLWNGSMAHWNTVFVEVPIETFNPVKIVQDLLRPQHLPDQGAKG